MKLLNQYTQAFIIVAALLLFVPFLGAVHLFDWDEINFAECAREMLSSGNYLSLQMNYQPFWEKPPLFIWMSPINMNKGNNKWAMPRVKSTPVKMVPQNNKAAAKKV